MTPIQIVVVRDKTDPQTNVFVETLRLAFEGRSDSVDSPSSYLSDAVDLGIRVLEPAANLDDSETTTLLGGARNTIVVVIGDLPEQRRLFESKRGEDQVHIVDAEIPPSSRDVAIQEERGRLEAAIAPVVTALEAMERGRSALTNGSFEDRDGLTHGVLKLFISHAKEDGIVVARSLMGVLQQLKESCDGHSGFEYFYDAEHIRPGSDWKEVLETEAQNCVLIALRTRAYESRYWCRREFLLAESNGVPIIEVDLRNEQYQDSSLLPFDVVPTIRVQDGNLVRVVLHAMAAHLRVLRVQYDKPRQLKVLPHRPSVYSLAGLRNYHSQVAYPGPKVSGEYLHAVAPILSSVGQTIKLTTYDELG